MRLWEMSRDILRCDEIFRLPEIFRNATLFETTSDLMRGEAMTGEMAEGGRSLRQQVHVSRASRLCRMRSLDFMLASASQGGGVADGSPLERRWVRLSAPLHASSTGWWVEQATSRLMVLAFRDLDVANERKRGCAAASPSPPYTNAGIVPRCYHRLLFEAPVCGIWCSEAAALSTR